MQLTPMKIGLQPKLTYHKTNSSVLFNHYNEIKTAFVYFSAKEAFEKRITPIIIDNTNIQTWEMKPYVALVSML